ncbi:hypothetical protein CFE70_004022 [Pyrenophora teres f. teres 0-1]|uniref:PH domain-containing protein n=2 Tax=Pyrenophora teres f. teres TaxID=97479 RepID=E3RE07_PYRTT|nr:hypothetical protein PTT_03553 [Pyrenophora teres f. teres 0-1]KAE8845509.1 hypothetical protein HRS9139_00076 [Pyrenophora teres f. teres]KAE8847647.1 hypothetical protein PTNB85_01490 [Pyrenophora teres f. teres]KAE8867575.1 hypothetical protein PTNB29_01486 [Pyrenophora teres f. teres]KAE8872343.1 hypothetical protein PTNB73_01494 [Pyrenophora teres f. teres]
MAQVSGQIHAPSQASLGSMRNKNQNHLSTSRWRFTRSTPNLQDQVQRSSSMESATAPTAPAKRLERVSSKISLFTLFTRPKVERARGHAEVGLAVPMRPHTPPDSTPPVSIPKSSLRQNPSPPAQQTIRARSSQIFRPTTRPAVPHNEFGSWDPPPLFQAFPQSLKHATVQACVFAPEVLMRSQSQRRQADSLRERMDSQRDLSSITENVTETKKMERSHRRLMSNSVLNPPIPELVNKIYILVTSGFVLQYAGDGPFDRLPEKVLKLGKESAAFACDLIPGKHWVLQISSHATDDGTFETGPKSSLLARLRSQNVTVRKSATSFLLVLESAEEMDAWMTTVRKEIDNLGGMKAKGDLVRASSSTDDFRGKVSSETTATQHQSNREPHIVSRAAPVDSFYSISPKIVTSDWEAHHAEQSKRSIDSSSGQSARYNNSRLSVEMSSVASTPISQHQMQLDQLRGRSRHSFMSTTTTGSGAGTRNTSRESSPAPQSPLKEESGSTSEHEPLRSAMSLRSFHMNPANTMSSRRRSMQPLPITDENFPQATKTPLNSKRHSLASPTSPTTPELGAPFVVIPPMPKLSTPPSNDEVAPVTDDDDEEDDDESTTASRASPPQVKIDVSEQPSDENVVPTREDSPVRFNTPTYIAPLRRDVISPPPKDRAPVPPPQARQPLAGASPAFIAGPAPLYASTNVDRSARRTSASPKPFLRPFPVRPQAQHGDSTTIVKRRQSSLTAPFALPLPIKVNRSVTAPIRPPSAASNMTPISKPHSLQLGPSQVLRRPVSVQIRPANSAPFTSSRPVLAISSTPSFVPGRRMSNVPNPATSVHKPTPSVEMLRQKAFQAQVQQRTITSKRSFASMGLPPPAPPPTMPLPSPPRNLTLPTPPPTMPLPPPPSSMGLPAPPPNMPLPPTPPEVALRGTAI